MQGWAGFPWCGARAHVWYLAHQVPFCEETDTRLFVLEEEPSTSDEEDADVEASDHLFLRAATGGDHRNEPTVSEAWAVLFLDGFWTGLDRVKTCQTSPFG